eukprot:scaffold1307_cov200-Pinguiococcus_pyrenoidosus.AAC.104
MTSARSNRLLWIVRSVHPALLLQPLAAGAQGPLRLRAASNLRPRRHLGRLADGGLRFAEVQTRCAG